MSLRLWNAKRTAKRIHKYEDYILKLKGWIRRDRLLLVKEMASLTDEENLEFGYQMGYVDYADYLITKEQVRK